MGSVGDDRLMASSSTTIDSREYDELYGEAGKDEFILCNTSGNNYYQGFGFATIRDYNQYEDTITIGTGIAGKSITLSRQNWTGMGSSSKLDTVIYEGNDEIAIIADYTGQVYLRYI